MAPREASVRVNEKINGEVKSERARRKVTRKREMQIVLAGQAESGKSTLLKQFQLFHAPETLDNERLCWVPVVHLNIIKAIRMIFADIDDEISSRTPDEPLASLETREQLAKLRMKLLPLQILESSLAWQLSGGVAMGGSRTGAFVRSGWQAFAPAIWPVGETKKPQTKCQIREVVTRVGRTMSESADDIEALWTHVAVKFYVYHRKIRLDDSASYFMRDIKRISEPEYCPTNDDIFRVRLPTLGVTERSFAVSVLRLSYTWKIYDIGGARGQRQTWIPYFDDATAVVFLAPISAFDQYLEEDPTVNRIHDSLQLFKKICSNQLLKKTHLVLLLNKIDILKEKLAAGATVRNYITSFGERTNDFETVSEYFRSHFLEIHRRKGAANNTLYVHFTSLVDTKSTKRIISTVNRAIIRKHITEVGLS